MDHQYCPQDIIGVQEIFATVFIKFLIDTKLNNPASGKEETGERGVLVFKESEIEKEYIVVGWLYFNTPLRLEVVGYGRDYLFASSLCGQW